MRAATTTLPRILALVSQFVTFCGFVVITAGLAKLQKKTDDLGSDIPPEIVSAYDTTFSYALVSPYSGSHHFQFSYIWWIIFFELFVLILTLAITLVPRWFFGGRVGALALLAAAFTLVNGVTYNLTYFHRSPVAQTVYGKRDINVTFAGCLLVVIGNGLTILTLGFWAFETPGAQTHVATTTTPHYGATANQAKREVETGTV